MGGAIAHAVLQNNIVSKITIIDPTPELPNNLAAHKNITHHAGLTGVEASDASLCLLAVKPQVMDMIAAPLKGALNNGCLILSIAAGKTITGFETLFGADTPIIRAMPNTPAMIGEGISVLCPNSKVTAAQKDMASRLLGACGAIEWIEDENHIDAVTAISGSGPAYLFYFMETLESAAIARGLPKNLAKALARQTVIGSAALAANQTDTAPSILRENVTSPNGTTAAALDILMSGEFAQILRRATEAAQKRSKELS